MLDNTQKLLKDNFGNMKLFYVVVVITVGIFSCIAIVTEEYADVITYILFGFMIALVYKIVMKSIHGSQ